MTETKKMRLNMFKCFKNSIFYKNILFTPNNIKMSNYLHFLESKKNFLLNLIALGIFDILKFIFLT